MPSVDIRLCPLLALSRRRSEISQRPHLGPAPHIIIAPRLV